MNKSKSPGDLKVIPADKLESGNGKDKEQRPQARREIGGRPGPEPTRYGDWEKGGQCIDF